MISNRLIAALLVSLAAVASLAQTPPEPQPGTPPPAPAPATEQQTPPPATVETTPPQSVQAPPPSQQPPTPSLLSGAASGALDRRDGFPNVNIYLPEGQASVRLRKLIRNVLFESQIDYTFVEGDISTFLRYKYYARNFTYRLGVFDEITFRDILSGGDRKEFERVRGGLLLFELPRDYNNRYYWLIQDDRLTFGGSDVDNRKNNVYTKISYQFGTQFDERLNAIVGESRGRITPVLTAFRELGPQKFSVAAAITESAKVGTGDYKYTKLESEALKRTDVSSRIFLVSRLHGGAFITRGRVPDHLDREPIEQYTIPRYEMFRLGGREALRAVGEKVESNGTHEVHLTNEVFVPIFRNRDFRTFLLHWNTMYGIGYVGAGAVGFDFRDITKSKNNVVDAGLGAEMSLTVRDLDVLFSILYARTLHAPDALEGGKWRFAIRTIR